MQKDLFLQVKAGLHQMPTQVLILLLIVGVSLTTVRHGI